MARELAEAHRFDIGEHGVVEGNGCSRKAQKIGIRATVDSPIESSAYEERVVSIAAKERVGATSRRDEAIGTSPTH